MLDEVWKVITMAHIAKYQSGAIGHMCALYENEAMQANGYRNRRKAPGFIYGDIRR